MNKTNTLILGYDSHFSIHKGPRFHGAQTLGASEQVIVDLLAGKYAKLSAIPLAVLVSLFTI